MFSSLRRLAPVAVVVLFVAAAVPAFGSTQHRGPLTGTWSGHISGTGFPRRHILIRVNASETAGSWRVSSTCYGPERLDSISGGYHHFLRKLGHGAHCKLAGDIDCLKRAGANLYDAVTTHENGAYDVQGTLHRV